MTSTASVDAHSYSELYATEGAGPGKLDSFQVAVVKRSTAQLVRRLRPPVS